MYGLHSEIAGRYGLSPDEEEPYISIGEGTLQNVEEGRFVYGFYGLRKGSGG